MCLLFFLSAAFVSHRACLPRIYKTVRIPVVLFGLQPAGGTDCKHTKTKFRRMVVVWWHQAGFFCLNGRCHIGVAKESSLLGCYAGGWWIIADGSQDHSPFIFGGVSGVFLEHLLWRWMHFDLWKRRQGFIQQHRVTTQKTWFIRFLLLFTNEEDLSVFPLLYFAVRIGLFSVKTIENAVVDQWWIRWD